jgi:predicted MFS family arabinose efflux permease
MATGRFFYGWVVLSAAAVITCVGMGTLFSLGVFLKPIEESTGWSRTGISTIALLNWIFMGVGSFLWGALSDRLGTRLVVLSGGFLLGLGLILSSQATALGHLQVTFGGLVGLGAGAFYAPLTATATRWFVAQRGLAVAIVSAGIGLGILLVSPLARWLATLLDWRLAMLVLGDLAWLIIIPVGLLVREQPADVGATARGTATERAAARTDDAGFTAPQALRSPQFWVIALTHFACCAAHSGPIFHMVTHAIDQGVAAMTAATVLSASGLASILGRLGTGILADRFGAKPTLLAGLALQAAAILGYLVVRETGGFLALALVFGVAYGGVMPVYALVVREYFGDRVMGTAYGGVFLVSTLGMGLGSFAGGLIHDTLGSYAWLFITSAVIGVMGLLLALTFRAPRPALAPAPALSRA